MSGKETNKGFGLFNVQQRIRLFSESEDYGITAETEEGKYAAFTILIKQPSDRKTTNDECLKKGKIKGGTGYIRNGFRL